CLVVAWASANSREGRFSKPHDTLFDGLINIVDAEYLIHDAGLDDFRGHAKNDAGRFVLRQNQAAGVLYRACTAGSVVAHSREHRGDAEGSRISGDGFHGGARI